MSPKWIDQTEFWLKIVHLFSTTICAYFDEAKHSAIEQSVYLDVWLFWSTENSLNLDPTW